MLGHRSYKTTFSSNCHGTVSVTVAIETASWKGKETNCWWQRKVWSICGLIFTIHLTQRRLAAFYPVLNLMKLI